MTLKTPEMTGTKLKFWSKFRFRLDSVRIGVLGTRCFYNEGARREIHVHCCMMLGTGQQAANCLTLKICTCQIAMENSGVENTHLCTCVSFCHTINFACLPHCTALLSLIQTNNACPFISTKNQEPTEY
jgi:hypothetical protein